MIERDAGHHFMTAFVELSVVRAVEYVLVGLFVMASGSGHAEASGAYPPEGIHGLALVSAGTAPFWMAVLVLVYTFRHRAAAILVPLLAPLAHRLHWCALVLLAWAVLLAAAVARRLRPC